MTNTTFKDIIKNKHLILEFIKNKNKAGIYQFINTIQLII
jgi:hypothetical protein